MHIKSIMLGFAVGVAITSALFLFFEPEIRDSASSATRTLGQHVEDVGGQIEDAGRKLK